MKEDVQNKLTAEEKEAIKAKENEFHSHRKMFYFDPKTGDIKFPAKKYRNMSHADWFKAIGVDIRTAIRGYYSNDYDNGRNCYCYIGTNFEVPNLSVEQYNTLIYIFEPWNIYLGAIPGNPGEIWQYREIMSIYER